MNTRRYFHTFDALRFLAFFCVFISHTPLFDFPFLNLFSKSGGIGVSFFFVLSGFLITYILLYEKENEGLVNLKKFFVRRILRIWPLFYAMILFAFATPHILNYLQLPSSSEGYQPDWLLSCLFLENYKMMFTDGFPNVSPLAVMWTLCIEEHFYILWGIAFYYTPTPKVPLLILLTILLANVSRVVYSAASLEFIDLFTNLDYFAYGAIPAYCLIKKDDLMKKVSAIPAYCIYLVCLITIGYVFVSPNINFPFQKFADPFIFGSLFSALIFLILSGNNLNIKSTNIFARLGIYTYGLYLFHTICINLVMQLFGMFDMNMGNIINNVYSGLISLCLSILLSIISFHLYEMKFIKFKKHLNKTPLIKQEYIEPL